jgi:hypothetical protein
MGAIVRAGEMLDTLETADPESGVCFRKSMPCLMKPPADFLKNS